MSNSPDPGRDQWPAPWASPGPKSGTMTDGQDTTPGPEHDADTARTTPMPAAAPVAGSSRTDADQSFQAPQHQDPYQAPYQQAPYQQTPYPSPDQGSGQPPHPLFTTPYGSPAPQQPRPVRDRRGPGWIGTVAVGAGAAVLASLLTAGIVESRDDSPASQSFSGSGPSASSSQNSAPLVNSTAANPNWTAVAAAVQPSVVAVQLNLGNGQGDQGSGIIYDTSGHVVTNNHVVADAGNGGQLSVILSDGRTYSASVVGTDPSTDLAVLKIKNPPSDLKPARIGNSSAIKVGDPVMAIGNPLGLSDTVTTGIVSALNRPVTTTQGGGGGSDNPFAPGQAQAEPVVTNAIQTDAAINPGNSGGALIDAQGRVIGVTSSIASLGASSGQSGNIGLGFAIPANEAKDVADQLIQTGSVKHALLGVTLKDGTTSVGGAQRQAAVVDSVTSGGAAASGGVKAGDAIIALNGTTIDGSDSLVAQIRALRPGTKVTLTVVRNGDKQDLSVTLGTRPATNG
ncbi:MAG TPA: trypsin-like peptidase domain-containing protein [Kineosporiaceae bacterium]|nr:trypsin-like peptidase domain-containing protein [Kineosporiaceae bacterium]